MTKFIVPGSIYLLDGSVEVTVLKPSSRSNLSYAVEIPGKSIELVSRDRLSDISESTRDIDNLEIIEFDE
jgi:hypothetical protein